MIRTIDEVRHHRELLQAAEERAKAALTAVLTSKAPMRALKFERLGCDPWDLEDAQNLAEQIDQQATYEAALDALEWLMKRHPNQSWVVAPGAHAHASLHDIVSEDAGVAAEVFAAVTPTSNRKLSKDIAKLAGTGFAFRYVFYRDAAMSWSERTVDGVHVVSLGQ